MPTLTMRFSGVDGDAGRILEQHFMPVFRPGGYVSVHVQPASQPAGLPAVAMPATFRDLGPRIRDLAVREDDLWVVSFPKTGQQRVVQVQYVEWKMPEGVALVLLARPRSGQRCQYKSPLNPANSEPAQP